MAEKVRTVFVIAASCLLVYLLAHFLVGASSFISGLDQSRIKSFRDCAQAARYGYWDIARKSTFYRNELDQDADGLACERDTETMSPAPDSPGAYEEELRRQVTGFMEKLGNRVISCEGYADAIRQVTWQVCLRPTSTGEGIGRQLQEIKRSPVNSRGDLRTIEPWVLHAGQSGRLPYRAYWDAEFALGKRYILFFRHETGTALLKVELEPYSPVDDETRVPK